MSAVLCLSLHLCQNPVTIHRIGPNDLSIGTLDPDNSKVIPTVTDTLFREGVISRNLVALFFQPTSPTSATNGEMTFGDVDPSKYTGHITYL